MSLFNIEPQKQSGSDIRVLTLEDTDKAARTLFYSFRTDSLANLLFSHMSSQEVKDKCEFELYRAYVRQHIMKGICLGINEDVDDFETVAIWSTPSSVAEGLDSFATLMNAGYDKLWHMIDDVGRQKIFYGMLPLLHDSCERILSNDSRFKNKKLFTLVYVGSLQKARGKGNARKMFEYMFKNHIDICENSISYLESSAVSNVPIYERFGFRLYEDIMLGQKNTGSVEGKDYAIMNVMIRGTNGHDWTTDINTFKDKGKL